MAIALEKELAAMMAAAQEKGDMAAFHAAKNRLGAIGDYREGIIDLEKAKYRLAKMPVGSRSKAPASCLAWNGETE